MPFKLLFTNQANDDLDELEKNSASSKRFKALGFLEMNPRHPGLNTHKYSSCGPCGEEIFEAYAENNTPAAYRIFWYYGANKNEIVIIAITPHP